MKEWYAICFCCRCSVLLLSCWFVFEITMSICTENIVDSHSVIIRCVVFSL